MSRTPLLRTLAIALLATLAACTALEGPQRPAAAKPSGAGAPPSSDPAARVPEGGAAPLPQSGSSQPSATAPARPPSETSGATQALLEQSRSARAAGNYAQANATIERALRIAPNDPSLWVELGEIELATGNAAQAATLARKALTLASENDGVAVADARQLLRAAGTGSH